MANPIILRRIKKLWEAGSVDAAAMATYVTNGLITQAEADQIMGAENASDPA